MSVELSQQTTNDEYNDHPRQPPRSQRHFPAERMAGAHPAGGRQGRRGSIDKSAMNMEENESPVSVSDSRATSAAVRIVLVYAAFAALWILLSDKVVGWLFSDPAQITLVSMIKGWLFVAVTALLLYGLIRRLLGQILAASRRELAAQTEKTRAKQLLDVIADSSTDAIFAKDLDGRYLLFNRETARVIGKSAEQALGCDDTALFPAQAAMIRANDIRVMAENMTRSFEETVSTVDGERTFLATKGPLRDADGQVSGLFGISRDITERKRTEAVLRESERRLQRVTEGSDQGFWDWNLASGSITVSARFETMLGYLPGEMNLTPEHWPDHVHPDDLAKALASIERHLAGESPSHELELRCRAKNGEWRWMLTRGRVVEHDPDGRPLIMSGTHTDITERKRADEALRIAAIAFDSQEGMFVTDAEKVILRVNRAFSEITGYSAEDAVGETPKLLRSGRHDEAFFKAISESLQHGGTWQGEIWNRRKNGEIYPEWLTISAVKDGAGTITNYVATLSDMTIRKATEDRIRTLAFYDPLTGLPNRRLLLDRLEKALTANARHQRKGALLFIDLDNFKTLNDTLGHDKGDLLLQQVAKRLSTCVREGDTVARLGGDEFVIILEDLSGVLQEAANQAEAVGEKILAALSETSLLGTHEHHGTASIGITLFVDHQETIEDLLKRADLSMYEAKAAGRNTLRFFDPEMQAVVSARAALEASLRESILKRQLFLHYQAQVTDEHQLTGVEVLVRWQHAERGVVSPADFIPLAEETGLILPLGQWVLETACAQLAKWADDAQMARLTVAVNVSARQFRQTDFVARVLETLARSGANPRRLKLELTESVLVFDVEDVIAKMTALKEQGVGFSLDDFGTGYSSLSYLKRMPLDQLKIDQGFVRDVLSDPNDAAIARMVIALGESLGLTVIAEGVETEAQRAFLAYEGCHAYQGYLFSRPLPLDQFETFARQF